MAPARYVSLPSYVLECDACGFVCAIVDSGDSSRCVAYELPAATSGTADAVKSVSIFSAASAWDSRTRSGAPNHRPNR